MSLVPYFDDICHDLNLFHSKFFDDTFWDFDSHFHHHFPSWCCCANILKTKVSVTDSGFRIRMNLPHFKPDEITVKTLDDVIVIEGKQKVKNHHCCVTKEFLRKYKLPRGYNPNEVTSTISSNGVLTVEAPAPEYIPEVRERIVEIKQIDD